MNFRLFKINRLKKKLMVLDNRVAGILKTSPQLTYCAYICLANRIPYGSEVFNLLKLNQDIATIKYRIQKLSLENFNYEIKKESRQKAGDKETFN